MHKTKILVVRDMALGDVIQTEPIIRALYDRHESNCEIDVATRYPDVFKNHPCVKSARYAENINAGEYNKIINLDWAYELDPAIHIQDAYRNVALGSDCEVNGSINIYTSDEDSKVTEQFLLSNNVRGPYVVLHMRRVGIVDGRNFSEDFWADIVEQILDTTDANIVQIGSGNDLTFSGDSRLINATGQFNVQQLKLLIETANVFLGSDSAPIHIAYSTSTPVVGLFTTVKAEYRAPRNRTAPFEPVAANIDCYGCKATLPAPSVNFVCSRGDVACVDSFDPKEIVEIVKKYL